MNLQSPAVGETLGPDWATAVVQSLSIIDSHNHSPGQGVLIGVNGLGINGTLPFNNNSAGTVATIQFTPQTVAPTVTNSLYASGVDLYYYDGNGDYPPIQITKSGAVNATSSGIVNGTASAGFVASVLVVNSASNTPANIQAGSILMGDNTAGSNYITVGPPNSLAGSYPFTLPAALPASTQILSLSNTGNVAASTASVVDGITVKSSSGTLVATVPTLKVTASPTGTGTVSSTTATSVAISGMSGNITAVQGFPVIARVVCSSGFQLSANLSPVGYLLLMRGSTQVSCQAVTYQTSSTTGEVILVDFPPSGTYTYSIRLLYAAATTVSGTNSLFLYGP
jgi:hypothetical protein